MSICPRTFDVLAILGATLSLPFICGCDDSRRVPAPVRQLLEPKDTYSGAVADKVSVLQSDHEVAAVDFSSDGRHLAAGAALGTAVDIWEWKQQSHIERTLHIPSGLGTGTDQSGLRFSPDGRLLAIVHGRSSESGGFGVVRIWRLGELMVALSRVGKLALVGSIESPSVRVPELILSEL